MKLDNAKTREDSTLIKQKSTFSNRVSSFTENKRNEITYLSPNVLRPYKNQARVIFDDEEILNLADTIKEHGIRQPLTVLRISDDPVLFEIVSGERRLRAAKLVGLTSLPCIIIEDKSKADEIALIENIQRQDLHPLELARSLKMLLSNDNNLSQKDLGKKIGLLQSQISELLKLLDLSEDVQKVVLDKNYRGRDNFRDLLKLKNDREQLDLISKYKVTTENELVNKSKQQNKKKIVAKIVRGEGGYSVEGLVVSKMKKEDLEKLLLSIEKIKSEIKMVL